MKRYSLLAACAALVAFAGCDATDDESYDTHTERVERQLKVAIHDRTGDKVESVECPDDFDLSVGETYECHATTTDGQALVALMKSESKGVSTLVKVTKAGE